MRSKVKRKILVLFDDLPSKAHPHGWKHALDQTIKIAEQSDVDIVSPVCLTLSLTRWKENRDSNNKLPAPEYKLGPVRCWRPRYVDFAIFPERFNRRYVHIYTMLLSMLLLIIRKKLRFDVIHAHFVYRPGYVAALLGWLLGKPVVISAHGSDIFRNLFCDNGSGWLRSRSIYAMRRSRKLIAVSQYLKNIMAEKGFGLKTHVIPCGYSERLFRPLDQDSCRKELSLPDDAKIILFMGNLLPIRGVDVLIRAFKLLQNSRPGVELIILGDGDERQALELQARLCGIESSLCFFGRVDHSMIPMYLNAVDLLVVPSRNEGRSVAAIEALACGTPVVASRVGGLPETLTDSRLGVLVEKEDHVALAEAIEQALSSSWDKKYISDHAQKFTQARLASQVVDLYHGVTNEAN